MQLGKLDEGLFCVDFYNLTPFQVGETNKCDYFAEMFCYCSRNCLSFFILFSFQTQAFSVVLAAFDQ